MREINTLRGRQNERERERRNERGVERAIEGDKMRQTDRQTERKRERERVDENVLQVPLVFYEQMVVLVSSRSSKCDLCGPTLSNLF